MELGELFLIEDARMGVEERVLWAAKHYRQKYGQAPTLCLLHPSLLPGARRLGGLRLEARRSILPNYLWLGAPSADERAAKPLAR
ncbi:MAG: hypothetical protein KIS85_03785 [Anaerolineales bacterium]|nr:hypothetical protein [Anaerolineales bacterium]